MNRRHFLSTGLRATAAAGMAAASYRRILGANSRVGLGLVGAGRRGGLVSAAFLEDNRVDLRAIADVYDVHRQKAAATLAKPGAPPPALVSTHEDLVARKDVDAVLIAVPDHLHLTVAQTALAARKHVYLEKPIIHRWEERIALSQAAAAAGTVLQCGTQQRSGAHYIAAKRDLFAPGKLGQVLFVRAIWNNFPNQQRHIAKQPKPAGLDWERFLGPAPKVTYETARYDSWRYFPDYGGGLLADILTHWADVAQWMMNDANPKTASALGGIYAYDDGRQNPDSVNAILQYDKWNLSFESSVTPIRNDRPSVIFEGTEGTLDIARDGYVWQPNQGQAVHVPAQGTLERAHTLNFLNAVLQNETISAPLSAGISACRPVQMSLKSYWNKQLVTSGELKA